MNQRDIAKIAGVSSATISRVINDDAFVAPKTKERVLKVIKEYGYVPNATAKNLKTSSTNIIGYLVPDLKNPFFTSLLEGFEELCYEKGYDIIFENTNENLAREKKALQTFLGYRVDGILAVFVDPDNEDIGKFKDLNIPIVCIDRKSKNTLEHDCILIDNFGGMKQIVEYLYNLGHRDIALIYGTLSITPGEERLAGFCKTMKELGVPVKKEYVINGYFNEEGSYKAVEKLLALEKRPTAVITSNNLSTMGAYKAFIDNNIKIGKDISLVGFDDFSLSAHLSPPITVLKRPNKEIGRIAAERLLQRIEAIKKGKNMFPTEQRLQTQLCIRESCSEVIPEQC